MFVVHVNVCADLKTLKSRGFQVMSNEVMIMLVMKNKKQKTNKQKQK